MSSSHPKRSSTTRTRNEAKHGSTPAREGRAPIVRDLRKAAAARTSKGMLSALRRVLEYYPSSAFVHLTLDLRAIRIYCDLDHLRQFDYGIRDLIEDNDEHELGAELKAVSQWTAGIGGAKAAAYFAEAVALYPRKSIARDPARRMWQTEAVEKRDPETFTRLDERFRGWQDDLRVPLQSYLRTAEASIEAMLMMPEPESDTEVPSAIELLEERNPVEAIDCLAGWAAMVDIRSLPTSAGELARITTTLFQLYFWGHSDGLWKYLEASEVKSASLLRAERMCVQIGANAAVRYLQEYRAVFPAGEVPSGRDARTRVVEQLEARFAAVDRRHKGALSTMIHRLHASVRANISDVDCVLRAARDLDERASRPAR